jgi:hypothetical protein
MYQLFVEFKYLEKEIRILIKNVFQTISCRKTVESSKILAPTILSLLTAFLLSFIISCFFTVISLIGAIVLIIVIVVESILFNINVIPFIVIACILIIVVIFCCLVSILSILLTIITSIFGSNFVFLKLFYNKYKKNIQINNKNKENIIEKNINEKNLNKDESNKHEMMDLNNINNKDIINMYQDESKNKNLIENFQIINEINYNDVNNE